MSRVLLYIARFAVIVIGYAVAALVASAFLHLLVLGAAGFRPDETTDIFVGSLFFSIPFTALFVGYFAFVPAGIAILAGEVFGLRGWSFYALAGAGVGLAVAVLIWQSSTDGMEIAAGGEAFFATPRFLATLVASGMVGGLGYWLCAGRSAGRWRQLATPTSSGPSGS